MRRLLALFGKGRRAKAQPREVEVIYLCDGRKCKNCSFPLCKHTTDIKHAKNFEKSKYDKNIYIEQ